jgi:poly-beta-1,6-N-acetyl-D-glucosamine synthase
MKYLVISPVKDEARHVERTLQSMAAQTLKPARWIIVDDGSTDGTGAILQKYQPQMDFMQIVVNPGQRKRQPGSAVIQAFQVGLKAAAGLDYDFIVKLDCDLSFEPCYFERLLEEFGRDPKLGIASGVYLETKDGQKWAEIPMPSYHAAGASKVVRRACFEEIDGFVAARGWDTVDEIRARARGWRTTHFSELKMQHWKPEGTGIGRLRTSMMHGEIYYATGGSILFFAAKVLHRAFHRPFLTGAVALFWGYARAALNRGTRLVTDSEARTYRAMLLSRITGRLRPFQKA